MKILVINCGSSSLKFQLIDSETEAVIAKGLCERIGIEGSKLIYTPTGGEKQEIEEPMEDHKKAVSLVIDGNRRTHKPFRDQCGGPQVSPWRRKICFLYPDKRGSDRGHHRVQRSGAAS